MYSGNQPSYYENSRGYIQTRESGGGGAKYKVGKGTSVVGDDGGVALKTLVTSNASRVKGVDSQEELVGVDVDGKIRVTKSVRISRVQNS